MQIQIFSVFSITFLWKLMGCLWFVFVLWVWHLREQHVGVINVICFPVGSMSIGQWWTIKLKFVCFWDPFACFYCVVYILKDIVLFYFYSFVHNINSGSYFKAESLGRAFQRIRLWSGTVHIQSWNLLKLSGTLMFLMLLHLVTPSFFAPSSRLYLTDTERKNKILKLNCPSVQKKTPCQRIEQIQFTGRNYLKHFCRLLCKLFKCSCCKPDDCILSLWVIAPFSRCPHN